MARHARNPKHKRHGGMAGGRRGDAPVLVGTLQVHGKSATVETPEGSYPVARSGVREAMGDDTVAVTISRRGRERFAHVQHVVERAITSFLGVYERLEPLGVVRPLDARVHHDFFVLPEDASPQRLQAAEGDVVRARIVEYPQRGGAGVVTLDARVGAGAELDLGVEAVIASAGIATQFPPQALEQAAQVHVDVPAALAQQPQRRDLRGELCVTVDPADARDFDDAVAAEPLPQGGWRLAVHIADVSHYVPWGTPLDSAARERGCSVYLADRVVPMLPEELSNDACSLNPQADRLAMTVLMELDAAAQLRRAEVFPSAIRSSARLSYDEVDALLQGGVQAASITPPIADMLRELAAIARLRTRARYARGAIDFASAEAKVALDATGAPIGVRVRAKTAATSLIEEAMLLANEAVAAELSAEEVESCYRVHEQPSPDDLAATIPTLQELGLVAGQQQAERIVAGDPFAIRAVLEQAAGTPAEELANALLLRAMKQAVYLPHNSGHYALGARAYCHFTSPIRRYPDLMVHRALKRRAGMPEAGAAMPDRRAQVQQENALPQICRSSSEAERVAERAERDSTKVKMAELYGKHLGEAFAGTVSGVGTFGLFVRLDGTTAEGRVMRRDLGFERYHFDEGRMELVGEESGTRWGLGRKLAVRVEGTDPLRGWIDLALADGTEPQGPNLLVGIR